MQSTVVAVALDSSFCSQEFANCRKSVCAQKGTKKHIQLSTEIISTLAKCDANGYVSYEKRFNISDMPIFN